jgi:hypothetical protein
MVWRVHTEVEGRLLLDVVVRKGPAIFELLASKNEALLVRGNALLVLDLALDIIDRIAGLDLKSDWRRTSETVTTRPRHLRQAWYI